MKELKHRRKLPRLATFESLLLPKLMRESPALPAKGRKSNRPPDDAQQSSPAAEMSSDFSGRQASAFYTCLAIPVEGATPILDQDTQQKSTTSQSTSTPKRAPRKSKTDALAAMQIQANSDDKSQSSYQVTGVRTFDDPGPPISISPALDMTSVKTTSPRNPPQRKHPRPFGLEDCPTYYPTMEEFKDPLGYIRSISDHAKNYGICKIVPPESWNMPFATDTEVSSSPAFSRRTRQLTPFLGVQAFRFKTRLQCLNSIEASSRAKVNFLEQLYRFHKQQGNPRVSVPTINNKSLDLWLLRKEVHKLGGYDAVRYHTSHPPPYSPTLKVNKGKKWADLGRLLGFSGIPGLSTQIKNSYTRVILPYEHFCERVRNNPSISKVDKRVSSPDLGRGSNANLNTSMTLMSTRGKSRTSASTTSKQKDRGTESSVKEEGASVYDDNSPPLSPLSSASSTLSDPPDERDAHDAEGTSETAKGKRKKEENGEGSSATVVNGKPRNGTSSTEVRSCTSGIIYTR